MAEEESTQGRQKRTRGNKLAPRSNVWKNYTHIRDADGNETGLVECNRCRNQFITKHGTSSLRKHVEKVCRGPARPPQQQQLLPSLPALPPACAPSHSGGSSDRQPALDEASKHLARMIALHGYDPSLVEDDCFRSFVASLNPEFRVPSRISIEERCDGIFDEARNDLLSRLSRAPGSVSLAVGKARAPEAGKVIYIACHFIDDEWNLHKVVLDVFNRYAFDHGKDVISEHPLNDKVVSIAAYERMDTKDAQLKDYIDKTNSRTNQMMNIVTLIKRLWKEKDCVEKTNSDTDLTMGISFPIQQKGYTAESSSDTNIRIDRIFGSKQKGCIDQNSNTVLGMERICCTTFVDNVLHTIARCLVPDPGFTRKIHIGMKRLHWTRQKCHQHLSRLGIDNPWEYAEHWYACYCSLKILRDECSSSVGANKPLTLLLSNIWGVIFSAIQRISDPRYPNSSFCLEELLNVRKVLLYELAQATDHAEYYKKFRPYPDTKGVIGVLETAKDHLDNAIQDSYLIWSIALALDPRHKLRLYLDNMSDAFGSKVGRIYFSQVKREIEKLYTKYTKGGVQATDEYGWVVTQTELQYYLNDPLVEETHLDILKWWKDNSQNYPTMALMARDTLAMPTCNKLSSEQMAQVRNILRGYSKGAFEDLLGNEQEENSVRPCSFPFHLLFAKGFPGDLTCIEHQM